MGVQDAIGGGLWRAWLAVAGALIAGLVFASSAGAGIVTAPVHVNVATAHLSAAAP